MTTPTRRKSLHSLTGALPAGPDDPRDRTPHKRAIARYAGLLCKEGETVAINTGSTTALMSEFLPGHGLTIVTNSFRLASRLTRGSDNDVVLTAGTVYREHDIVLSPFDNDSTQQRYASKLFTGAFGISAHGLTESDPLRVQATQRLARLANHMLVLADSDKLARKADLILCTLREMGTLITDTEAPDAVVQMLERAGVRVVTVTPEAPGAIYH